MKVIVASGNRGKIREMKEIFGRLGIEVRSMAEAGICPGEDLPENEDNFLGNAVSKARALQALAPAGTWTLGDDSGLVVDALGGAPGVYSARFAGVTGRGEERDRANNEKLLAGLSAVAPEARTARFVCAMALLGPAGEFLDAQGTCEGHILSAPRGHNGFGYDPLFQPSGFDRTMAELSLDEKNRISHRGAALRTLIERVRARGLT